MKEKTFTKLRTKMKYMETLKHFMPAVQIVSDGSASGKDNYTANMVINLPNHYYINDLPHVSMKTGSGGEVDVTITLRTTLLTSNVGSNNNFMIRSASYEVPTGSAGTVTTVLFYDDNGTTVSQKTVSTYGDL